MIKGIILDVDGVIVGEKVGYNSPNPHPDVISQLRDIESRGIPISLCTAKPHYAIRQIINDADLRSLHITEGGAIVIDPIDDVILKSHAIDTHLAKWVVQSYINAHVYVEAYGLNEYLLDSQQQHELTKLHSHILQCEPHIVDSLVAEVGKQDIYKIMPIAKDETEKSKLEDIFTSFADKLTLSWGVHPIALPYQFGIITAKDISKSQAALDIAKHNGITPSELLGIGDSTSDWQFIEQCGYAATMANGSSELKELVSSKSDKGFIGGSVDDNGILAIFDYFNL